MWLLIQVDIILKFTFSETKKTDHMSGVGVGEDLVV